MQNSRRRLINAALAMPALACFTPILHAQDAYPSQPVRLVVPFTPGSGTDVIARSLAEQLQSRLQDSVVVENRAGAGGTLGATFVATAKPDGHTVLLHSAAHVISPAIYPSLRYDTLKDFTPIAIVATLPNVLVVSPTSPYGTVADLVSDALARPEQTMYGSAGNGSATHMNAEKFRLAAEFDAIHVPYKGTPEMLTEIMAGRLDWGFAPLISAMTLLKAGKLRALAVGTPRRSAALPEVPTTTEAGYPESAYTFWVALFAPAATPPAVVSRLHDETGRIQQDAAFRARLFELGAEAASMSQADFTALVARDLKDAATIVARAKLRAD